MFLEGQVIWFFFSLRTNSSFKEFECMYLCNPNTIRRLNGNSFDSEFMVERTVYCFFEVYTFPILILVWLLLLHCSGLIEIWAISVVKDKVFIACFNPLNANPLNGQTHSNKSSPICGRIVCVCLTILWDWRLKG